MKKLLFLLLFPLIGISQFNPIFFYQSSSAKTFTSSWNTANTSAGSSTSTQIKLPLVSTGTYNFVVDWGDGSTNNITVWNAAATTHTYASSGTYTLKITGICTGWQFLGTGDRLKILSIQQWGGLRLGNVGSAFLNCANLTLTSVSDVLVLNGASDLAGAFSGCTALTTINRANEWNTSSIISLNQTFSQCPSFNQNISSWNTSAVTNMFRCFLNCAAFNQNIGGWNVGSCTNFQDCFNGNTAFNQNLASWNVSSATTFQSMFQFASNFNNGLGSGISGTMGWNINSTSNVSMNSMFNGASKFNQIINWNTIKVTDMSNMFQNASVFNNGGDSGIGSWNVSSVTTMTTMFNGATAFAQNIGSWNVSNVTNFTNFMASKTAATYSTSNMDAIYNGWSALSSVKPGISISFGTAKYTAGSSAGKLILTSAPNNWVITDGGI